MNFVSTISVAFLTACLGERERERERDGEREREGEGERERESVCVCERERVCMQIFDEFASTKSVAFSIACMRMYVRVFERERESMYTCVCVRERKKVRVCMCKRVCTC